MPPLPHGKYSGQRLVVFGCGYVGSALGLTALERGMEVTALTRNPDTASALRAAGFHGVVADLATDAWHDAVPAAPEFALNCVSSGGGGTEGYRRSYVGGMASVLRWAATRGRIGTFVYTSSTSVYTQQGGVTVDETAGVGGDERAGILVEAERTLGSDRAACARWFILRLAGIYGPGRHRFLDQLRSGVVPAAGGHHLNLVHRDDIVSAIWSCFSAPSDVRNEVFNLADDGAATRGEIVEWLRAGVPSSADGTGVGGMGEPARRPSGADRVVANAKAKAVLGWQPGFPTFREGYRAILGAAGTSAIL